MGKLFIVIGAPGQGKSPYTQKIIEGRRCWVFDINNEYGSRTKYPGQIPINLSTNPNELRSRFVGDDIKAFRDACFKKRDTICVFEEATAFFRGAMQADTMRLIIGKLHTGNTYVFLFHSINRVPPAIMEMTDYVVLFKTLDEDDTVMRKYSRLSQHFFDLQQQPDGSHRTIKML